MDGRCLPSAAAGPEQPRMASRARPDGKQRLPYGLGWPGTVAVPGSAHRRVSKADEGHHPIKPRKRIQHNVPGCTSGSAFRAPLPARTYEQPHYNRGAPGKQGPSTAPHLLSTRCRNAPSVPAPSGLRDRDPIDGAGQLGTVSGLPPRRGCCAHLLQSQPLCLLWGEYRAHGVFWG